MNDLDTGAWFEHLVRLEVASRKTALNNGLEVSMHEYLEHPNRAAHVLDALVYIVGIHASIAMKEEE